MGQIKKSSTLLSQPIWRQLISSGSKAGLMLLTVICASESCDAQHSDCSPALRGMVGGMLGFFAIKGIAKFYEKRELNALTEDNLAQVSSIYNQLQLIKLHFTEDKWTDKALLGYLVSFSVKHIQTLFSGTASGLMQRGQLLSSIDAHLARTVAELSQPECDERKILTKLLGFWSQGIEPIKIQLSHDGLDNSVNLSH